MRRSRDFQNHQPLRRGAALMEVLIAILAMGIGVVSLMSLFPLSVVRTAQAHQMTVGTGLRLNAEAFLENNRYVWVDPNQDGAFADNSADSFLFDPLGIARGQTGPIGGLTRYHGGFTSLAGVQSLIVYDGNWKTQSDEQIVQNLAGANSITLNANTNLSTVPTTGNIPSRILLFDQSLNRSEERFITNIVNPTASPQVDWTVADPVTLNVTRVRVETMDEQFSWMLSVHRHDADNDDKPYGDVFVAVFFRREFSAESETVYPNTGAANVFNFNSTTATVDYSASTRPAIRKGGYVLDAQSGYWYRVSDYSENTVNSTITMTLDTPARFNSNGVVFFKGLADVYNLGTLE